LTEELSTRHKKDKQRQLIHLFKKRNHTRKTMSQPAGDFAGLDVSGLVPAATSAAIASNDTAPSELSTLMENIMRQHETLNAKEQRLQIMLMQQVVQGMNALRQDQAQQATGNPQRISLIQFMQDQNTPRQEQATLQEAAANHPTIQLEQVMQELTTLRQGQEDLQRGQAALQQQQQKVQQAADNLEQQRNALQLQQGQSALDLGGKYLDRGQPYSKVSSWFLPSDLLCLLKSLQASQDTLQRAQNGLRHEGNEKLWLEHQRLLKYHQFLLHTFALEKARKNYFPS
jgi:hypothetical protein